MNFVIQDIHNISNFQFHTPPHIVEKYEIDRRNEYINAYYEHMIEEMNQYKKSAFQVVKSDDDKYEIMYNLKVYIMVNTLFISKMSKEQQKHISDILQEFKNKFPGYSIYLDFWFNI